MKSVLLKHILVWTVYLTIPSAITILSYPGEWTTIVDSILQNFLYIGVFYLVYYAVFKSYFQDHQLFIAILNYILCFFINLFAVHFLFSYLLPLFENRDSYKLNYQINRGLIADVILNYSTFTLYAFLYWQFSKRVLLEKRLRIEQTEKLKTEYAYLKSQINPHFLFNTLGYFYTKIRQLDKQTADGLASLSDLMRYSLNTGNENGKVPLKKEIEQIENYITLQQLRFSNQLHIHFQANEVAEHLLIIPHALITLVENAFKYGVSDDPLHPILLHLKINAQKLHFTVSNKISHRTMDWNQTGIGLQNLTQRLALEYPNKFFYGVERFKENYTTTLEIEI